MQHTPIVRSTNSVCFTERWAVPARAASTLAEKLGVDCSKFEGPTVPVVYNVSFKDPAGYFLATRFQMHNKDLVFAAMAMLGPEVIGVVSVVDQVVPSRRTIGHMLLR